MALPTKTPDAFRKEDNLQPGVSRRGFLQVAQEGHALVEQAGIVLFDAGQVAITDAKDTQIEHQEEYEHEPSQAAAKKLLHARV